jgi:hypothetical protein
MSVLNYFTLLRELDCMGNLNEYSGIRDAVDSIQSNSDFPHISAILAEVPSKQQTIKFTEALTGFEVGATVSKQAKNQLDLIESLYQQSEPRLIAHASEMGVKSLNEFSPESVLYMVCIRELQSEHAGKSNLNPHKFSVLKGARYTVK